MRFHRHAVLALALVGALACVAPSGVAADDPSTPAPAPGETDHWWGGMGAVMCGLGLREAAFLIGNPGWMSATIGGCLLALIDVIAD